MVEVVLTSSLGMNLVELVADLIAGAEIHAEDLAFMSHQESLSEGEDKRISCLVDSLRHLWAVAHHESTCDPVFFQSNNKEQSRQQERIKAVEMGKGSLPAPLVNKDSLLAHCIAGI